MLARDIAKRYGSAVFGIEEEDCVQEANKGLILAAKLYNPNKRTKDGKRIKFNTYAHRCAELLVKEWIMESSRLVRVPKSKLRRLFVLINVSNQIDSERNDMGKLTKLFDEAFAKRLGRALKEEERMTVTEAAELINMLQGNSIPLDLKADSDEDMKSRTIGEMLSDPAPSAEVLTDRAIALDKLTAAIKIHLDPIEQDVIYKRYLDPTFIPKRRTGIRSLDEISIELAKIHGQATPFSRERIRQIEAVAFQKIRDNAPELKEIIELGVVEDL
jgi:DNA-directed RNA polymerase sigma subunit (sigma70/sigma32)